MILYRSRTIGSTFSRRRVHSDGTWFVRQGGSNGNDGALNTDARAFADIQGAWTYLQSTMDFNGYGGQIKLDDGTYTSVFRPSGELVGYGSATPLQINGNLSDNTKVRLQCAGNTILSAFNARLAIDGLTFSTTGAAGDAIYLDNGSYLQIGNIRIEDVAKQMLFLGFGSKLYSVPGTTLTIAGSAENFLHHTHKATPSFEDASIAFIPNPVSGLNPQFSVYLVGGNDSSVSFNRTTITGDKAGRVLEHLQGMIKHNTTSGHIFSTFFFVDQPADLFDTGSQIYYTNPFDTVYLSPTGDNRWDGYEAARSKADLPSVISYLAHRPPSQELNPSPTVQYDAATYSGGQTVTDIPGCAVATLLGDPSNPMNCQIITTSANCIESTCKQTYWIIDGFYLESSGAGLLSLLEGARVGFRNCILGPAGGNGKIITQTGSYLEDLDTWSSTGDSATLIYAGGGEIKLTHEATFLDAQTYSTCTVFARRRANIRWDGTKTMAMGASVTGTRVDLADYAFLDSNNTTDQTSIPGTVDGPVDAGTFALMI